MCAPGRAQEVVVWLVVGHFGTPLPVRYFSGGRARIQGVADAPNRVWAVDFQFDATTDGRPVKIVSIIDEHTRECLGGMVERSITGEHLIDQLDRLAADRGTYPAVLRCDNGPELAWRQWPTGLPGHVGLHFIPPGSLAQRLRRIVQLRIRDECLNINSFWSLAQARVVISDWKHDYNHHRRHSSLGYQPPGPLRCHLYPPMNDSRSPWTNSPGSGQAPYDWNPRKRSKCLGQVWSMMRCSGLE